MNVKRIFLVILALLPFGLTFAQDKIYKKNGEIIEAKVSTINTDVIIFKKYDNPDGPQYSIPKSEVIKIRYSNGTEDIFEENDDKIGVRTPETKQGSLHERVHVNNNIISFAPLEFTENGDGIAFTWEHNIDKSGWVSFYVPVIAAFHKTSNTITGAATYDPLYYCMPGIKVYTNLNSTRRAKFSIGPSLVIAKGTHTVIDNSVYIGMNPPTTEQSHFMLGTLVNFGFNYFTTNRVYIGFDYGIGLTYLNEYAGINQGFATLQQLSFRIGYRYHSGSKNIASLK